MKTLLLTLLLCCSLLCSAQVTTIKPTGRITGIAPYDTETIMVLADNINPNAYIMDVKTNVVLQKYNLTSGAKVWEKALIQSRGTYTEQQRIKRTSDGGYIVNMRSYTFNGYSWESQLQLIRTDEAGEIIWNKIYDKGTTSNYISAYDLNETKDGGFVITGTNSSSHMGAYTFFIIKVDDKGEEQWRNLYPSTYSAGASSSVQANQVLEAKNGGYLVVGRDKNGFIYGTSQSNEDILVIKVDDQGNETWRRNIDRGGRDIAWTATEASNGDFIVGGSTQDDPEDDAYTHKAFATRISQAGDVVWSKVIFGDTLSNEIRYIQALDDNTFAAIGNNYHYKNGTGANDCYKVIFDEQGTVISENPVLANIQLFHYENTPLNEVVVGYDLRENQFKLLRGNGENSGGCNIQTSISVDGSLDLCPGESVTLTAGEGFSSYKWSSGQTTRSITVSQGGQYKVEVTNEIGCPYATEPVTVTVKQPYSSEKLCYVTVDKETGKNKLLWTKTPDKNTVAFDIYKNGVNGFTKIGSVPFNDAAKFIDHDSQPDTKTDRYAIRAVDNCGNVSSFSMAHKTVLLQSSLGTSGEINLIWNRYEGAVVSKITIFRGPHMDTLNAITTLSGQEDRYIDRNPVKREHMYVLGIELATSCSAEDLNGRAAAASALVYSNALSIKPSSLADEIAENSKYLLISPNPIKQEARISIDPMYAGPFTVQLYNTTGQVVQQHVFTKHENLLRREKLPAGIYYLQVKSRDNKFFMKKVIFTAY